jgi:hypothetical protein
VVATARPSAGVLTAALDQRVPVDRSGWLAVRVTGGFVPDVQGERVAAHTSPVYLVVAGKPAGLVEDARYFLRWIDRLWEDVEERDRIPGERWQAEVRAEVEQARQVYRRILGQSEAK